jgi:hypothetical protein
MREFVESTSTSVHKENLKPPPRSYDQGAEQNRDNYYRQFHGIHFEGGRHRVAAGAGPAPSGATGPYTGIGPNLPPSPSSRPVPVPTPRPDFEGVKAEADAAGQHVKDALSVSAAPQIDTSGIQSAISLARQLKAELAGVGQASAAAAGRARQQIEAANRQTFGDFGVYE